MTNLDLTFIRAKGKDDEWGSYSLQGLIDMGCQDQVWDWFIGRLCRLLDLKEGEVITEVHVKAMVAMLEVLGFTIVRLKREFYEDPSGS